jgi:hypothetical protein
LEGEELHGDLHGELDGGAGWGTRWGSWTGSSTETSTGRSSTGSWTGSCDLHGATNRELAGDLHGEDLDGVVDGELARDNLDRGGANEACMFGLRRGSGEVSEAGRCEGGGAVVAAVHAPLRTAAEQNRRQPI